MSSRIYFNDADKKKTLQWYLVRTLSEIYRRLLPSIAAKQTRALLLKPQRFTEVAPDHQRKEFKLDTPYGALHCYEVGSGPIILFIHGWSGAAQQFFPMMQSISEQGYKTISFDHFGHGKSDLKEASLPLLIKGINYVNEFIASKDSLAAIVSHSIGSIASINAFKHHKPPQFLIAPLFDFIDSFYQRVLRTGLSPVLVNNLIQEIEQEHDTKFEQLDINDHIAQYRSNIHIIHDKRDRFSKYKLSLKTSQTHPHITLHTTNGLGHIGILKAEETFKHLKKFITL